MEPSENCFQLSLAHLLVVADSAHRFACLICRAVKQLTGSQRFHTRRIGLWPAAQRTHWNYAQRNPEGRADQGIPGFSADPIEDRGEPQTCRHHDGQDDRLRSLTPLVNAMNK